jgi:hypothetical protein
VQILIFLKTDFFTHFSDFSAMSQDGDPIPSSVSDNNIEFTALGLAIYHNMNCTNHSPHCTVCIVCTDTELHCQANKDPNPS